MEKRATPIHLVDVTVRRGDNPVLAGFNFAVRSGERVIPAGKNGTGKTTLLKTVLALLPAERGSVAVLGLKVGTLSRRAGHSAAIFTILWRNSNDFSVHARLIFLVSFSVR